MNKVGRNTLLKKTLVYLGFSFGQHPVYPGHFVQLMVLQIKNEDTIVICSSEGVGKGNVELARSQLGSEVSGLEMAPYAQRCISGGKTNEILSGLKKALNAAPFTKWHWK
jgi:hypothetical protein